MGMLRKWPDDCFFIGLKQERKVIFDVSSFEKRFGKEGRVELLYRPPRVSDHHPVLVERVGSTVVWTITAENTATAGAGSTEMRYYIGDTLVESVTGGIIVGISVDVPGEAPTPRDQSWLDQVLEAANRAEEAAERAESGGFTVADDGNGNVVIT